MFSALLEEYYLVFIYAQLSFFLPAAKVALNIGNVNIGFSFHTGAQENSSRILKNINLVELFVHRIKEHKIYNFT